MKNKKQPGMDVPLFMKIRISLSLVLTLGVAYIALACEEGGERWKLLPDPQSQMCIRDSNEAVFAPWRAEKA